MIKGLNGLQIFKISASFEASAMNRRYMFIEEGLTGVVSEVDGYKVAEMHW